MNKTILIPAIAAAFVAFLIMPASADPPQPISFSWNPDDSSSDPNNLIVVSGSFSRIGLLSDTTTDVQAELSGKLIGKPKNNSETTVTTIVGTTTITTSVSAFSRSADNFNGVVTIDGETYAVMFKTTAVDPTILEVSETFSGPTFSQSLEQNKLTILGSIDMCTDDDECLEGFGTIRREVSITSSGGNTITFATDELEAEVIGDSGLFELKLSKLQRTVEITAP